MKYLIIIIICLVNLNACSSQHETNGSVRVKFSGTSIPEFVVSKVVRLSSRDDALLDRFYRLRITSRHYLVGDRSKIIVYTKTGDIHAVINAIGAGPEETPDMSSFHADDNSIMVMNMWKNHMLEFDFDGKFLKTTALKSGYFDFTRYRDGYLFDAQQQGTDAGNVLIFADMDGSAVKEAIPIADPAG
jgi:hypothetical protein